ncbi:apolipoprotein N-acyltransferase [Amaricoccus macauensis]|uniref:apolipoprotein N-acyltransferase n=1 Tax=Amaricoccus macauensis TaxID=57001 RepID=UPI003C7A848F
MAAAAGAFMGLAQAPVSWPLVYAFALPLLFWLHGRTQRGWTGFRIGWAAGAGYFTVVLFWIVEPFLVDIRTHGWMAPFALIGMAGGLSLFWAAAFGLTTFLRPKPLMRVICLASLWTLAEYARAHVLTGFPWGLLAYGWIDTPVAQGLSLVGPHGLDFLTMLAGLALGLARPAAVLASVALVGALWGFGAWRLSQPVELRPDGFVVRVVQPNAAQDIKWQPGMAQVFYERLLAETAARAEGVAPSAVVWPETAVPFLLGERPELQTEIAGVAGPDATVVLGLRRREWQPDHPAGEAWYNSLAVLAPETGDALAVYDKHHLVPFGEYFPLAKRVAGLGLPGLTGLTGTGFDAGPGPVIMSETGLPPFLPLICYEAIFTNEATIPEVRPDWFVQITNDAWFGKISGPYQHLAQARARSIEYGLPLVRSANTGISAITDPYGRVLASIPLGRQGHADAQLALPLEETIYMRVRNWPLVLLILPIFQLTLSKVYGGMLRQPGQ